MMKREGECDEGLPEKRVCVEGGEGEMVGGF